MHDSLQSAVHRILTTPWGRSLIRLLVFLMIFQGFPALQLPQHYTLQPGRLLSILHQLSKFLIAPQVYASACAFDDNGDGDVDGSDLQVFAGTSFSLAYLSQFASEFGRNDCRGYQGLQRRRRSCNRSTV